ncbi:TdeIII family type II restriction endonuclease [Fimbriimonadia bacterium ATM]|nr:MAG: TdeIII family type II restriction endonuclease [Armatimonadota bacterium]MBC6970287.1 TdeIII family type II restriction endonuclease [Armatimonadota bacterium]MCE7899533.1 TdeIII family type II restriction endonuclease [Armatimonadetes bacterium ATM1]MDL1927622.1 TdeIII family type II restriction endonuclease [Fimbriimonadia bacterium ATM]RIJ96450.1 MAG: TdeIII family type II restriction endonuclease [Armatimonadota bacterium]
MAAKEEIKSAIQGVIRDLMSRVMHKVMIRDPFVVEEHRAKKPIYAALVPDEIFKGAHFERRFVTPFGKVWERIAAAVARKVMGNAEIGYRIKGTVRQQRMQRIQEVLNKLEHGRSETTDERTRPDWEVELKYVLDGGGEPIPTEVICDVYAWSIDAKKGMAFELKAPLPNSDQTKVSKEKILKLYAMDPTQVGGAYYALPYNPYGRERTDYRWGIPGRWFNMQADPVVLIGREFWDALGGPGTYEAFIDAVNELGGDYRDRIYRDYLGMEPPEEPGRTFTIREENAPYEP